MDECSHRDRAAGPAIDWGRFEGLLRPCRRIAVTTHIRPDGDAIGSALAMADVLRQGGKEVLVVGDFELSATQQLLDPDGQFRRLGADVSAEDLREFDAILVVDTSAWAQLGGMAGVFRAATGAKIVLDHHQSSDEMGAEVFRDTSAEASGRLVYEAARRLGAQITPPIAAALFAALSTDTGWFRFASTGADTYRLAAELVAAGAVPSRLYQQLYENDSLGRLKLIGRAMARTTAELSGRLMHTVLELSDFEAAGALPPDSEDIINMLLTVRGAEFAVIFVEQRSGGFKISFRSRCGVDCSRLAAEFGGGGHRGAAGAMVRAGLADAQTRVLDAVRRALQ